MKPNPDFFEKAKNGLDVKASEMLFIDDNAMNVKSASDVGFSAAMFNAYDHPSPAGALVEVLNQHGIYL
jgi:FMN phosphatase YigB (HAD superfamily)